MSSHSQQFKAIMRPLSFNKKSFGLCVSVGLCLVATPSFAGVLDQVVVTTTGNATRLAIGAGPTAQLNAVNLKLMDIGRQLGDEFSGLENFLATLSQTQIKAQRDLMVAENIAHAQERAIEIYGNKVANSIDPKCINASLGEAVAKGNQAIAATIAGASAGMAARVKSGAGAMTGTGGKVEDLLTKVKEKDAVAANIYPPSKTRTAKQQKITEDTHALVIDPFPPSKVPDKLTGTPAGKKYEALRMTEAKTKLAPQQATALVDSMDAPTMPVGVWAKKLWSEINTVKGAVTWPKDPVTNVDISLPPGLTFGPLMDKDGNMSFESYLALFIKSRLENESWYADLDADDDMWQLRQINISAVKELEIENREMILLNHVVELLAQDRSNEIDSKQIPMLQELQKQTESAQ